MPPRSPGSTRSRSRCTSPSPADRSDCIRAPSAIPTAEAVQIARALDWKHPIKVQSLREEEFKVGRYRAMAVHRVRAGADADGRLTAWHQQIVAEPTSVNLPFVRDVMFTNGVDFFTTTGAVDPPYAVENFRLESTNFESRIPTMVWRSVGNSHTEFARESAIDELAIAAGRDPVDLRRELLAGSPRTLRALELAAERADWGSPLPEGRARGITSSGFLGHSAQVTEVSLDERGRVHVDRIVFALDCGRNVNPDLIRAQVEGGLLWGLSAAAWGEVVLGEGGDIVTQNFDALPGHADALGPADRGPPDRLDRAADRSRRGQRPVGRSGTGERDRGSDRHPNPPAPHHQDNQDRLGGHPDARRQHHPQRKRPLHRLRAGDAHRAGRTRDRAPRPDGHLPLRRLLEQAVLRRHARHDRLRRNARQLIADVKHESRTHARDELGARD